MNDSGLTLIEILVSLLIITVAFMALSSTQITNLQVTRDSDLASISTQVANSTMERVTKWLLEQEDGFGNPTFSCGGDCTGSYSDINVKGKVYTGSYVINVDASTGIAQIDVTVTEPKTVTFSQLVSCMDVVPAPSFADPAPCPATS